MALIGLLAIAVVVLLCVAAVLFSVWTMPVLVDPGVASRFRVAAAGKPRRHEPDRSWSRRRGSCFDDGSRRRA